MFDKFHVLQHASTALDEVRRQEFFRAGTVMRAHGRGKRWLLLRRWKTVHGSNGDFLNRHLEGIAAYCFHPVRLALSNPSTPPSKLCCGAPEGCATKRY